MPKTKKVPLKTIQVREDVYEQWADFCKRENKFIKDMTEQLIIDRLAGKKMDIVEMRLEDVIGNRLDRFMERIAGMWGRQGMDVAMVLMAVSTLLSRDLNRSSNNSDVDIEDLLEMLRPLAAKHFSRKKDDKFP